LTSIARPELVREQARALGVTLRQGKVDAYALLMVIVLGLVVRGSTSIAQLGQIYGEVTGQGLARSSFWDRLTPSFAELVSWLLEQVTAKSRSASGRPPGVLAGFTDVLAADSTVIKVADELREVWKGTRRNSAAAALKVHAWIRAFTGELVKFRITPEAFGDSRAFGIDHALRGVLMLFDRGYASPSLWRRIDSVGGYFLTRIPKGWNQVVTSENRAHRGRARSLVGKSLQGVLLGLKRAVVDVNATFRCRVRGYDGENARIVEQEFRVVALRGTDGEYRLYVTNAPPELLPAEEMRSVYRLRWEVEIFFKTAKSWCALSEIPCRSAHRVETLLHAALLRATLAMRAKACFLRIPPARNGSRINPHQWMRWWNRQLHTILDELVSEESTLDTAGVLRMLADPNRGRIPTRYAFAEAA
jgi:IS4 transposase